MDTGNGQMQHRPTRGTTAAAQGTAGGGATPAAPASVTDLQLRPAADAPPVPPEVFAHYAEKPVQRRASAWPGGQGGGGDVHRAAAEGTAGAASALPHGEAIQRSFGRHDVSQVQAYVGGPAKDATARMGATAYATGDKIAFGGQPDLATAAHEAAHVVQQRAGLQLPGGVGAVGDPHERHADEVAARVVQGKSAEDLLSRYAGGAAPGGGVQMKKTADEGAPAAAKLSLAKHECLNEMGFLEPGEQIINLSADQIAQLGLVKGASYSYEITQVCEATKEQAGDGDPDEKKALRGKQMGTMRVLKNKKLKEDADWKGETGGAGRYTEAAGGKKKLEIDQKIKELGVKIDPGSEQYWKAFIKLASQEKGQKPMEVLDKAKGMQFFFLESAWEGFFPKEKKVKADYAWDGHPVSETTVHDVTKGDDVNFYNPLEKKEEQFNASNTLVVFDSKGKLVFVSPLLTRLGSKQDHGDWDNKSVKGARPKGYDYYGLSVNDGDKYFADIHDPIGSHGCYQTSTYSLDARFQGKRGGYEKWQKAAEKFQERYLEAHPSVAKGKLKYDGSEPLALKAKVTHVAFAPTLEVTPKKKGGR